MIGKNNRRAACKSKKFPKHYTSLRYPKIISADFIKQGMAAGKNSQQMIEENLLKNWEEWSACHPAVDLFTQPLTSLAHFFAVHAASFAFPAILPPSPKFCVTPLCLLTVTQSMC
jgi:hypothetical protein